MQPHKILIFAAASLFWLANIALVFLILARDLQPQTQRCDSQHFQQTNILNAKQTNCTFALARQLAHSIICPTNRD